MKEVRITERESEIDTSDNKIGYKRRWRYSKQQICEFHHHPIYFFKI